MLKSIVVLVAATMQSCYLAATAISVNDFVSQPKQPNHQIHSYGTFSFYDEFISPIDGERCQMYPSCSHYSRIALKQKGFVIGALMTFDRLMRCGYDLKTYKPIYREQRQLYQDPVTGDRFED